MELYETKGKGNSQRSLRKEIGMISCPNENCSTNETTGFYCYRCGTKLIEAPACECGYELSSFEIYCRKCGKKVEVKE